MDIGKRVLANKNVIFLVASFLMFFGAVSYFSLPAREDPALNIRVASVIATNPGLSAEKMELEVTKTLEEALREQGEVKEIDSMTQPGFTFIKIELKYQYNELDQIWDNMRTRLARVQHDLPEGTSPPVLDDDFSTVAALTVALQSDEYSPAEQFDMAQHLRAQLYALPNTEKIDIIGAQEERIFIEVSNARLRESGITPSQLSSVLSAQNIIGADGQIENGQRSYVVEPTGGFGTLEDIENLLIRIPGEQSLISLKDIAEVRKGYVDPPERKAYFNGRPAIMLALNMVENNSVLAYGEAAKERIDALRETLPAGYDLSIATFQASAVSDAVYGVSINVIQTLVIVLAVVIFFLGLRTGLIVGSIVPVVILITLAIMAFAGMDLQRMSLATLIIALGLLVDNAIVIAEEFKVRLGDGQDREKIIGSTIKDLAFPLLASTTTIILVFLPLMIAQDASSEYTQSIAKVILISLSSSWLLAMTVTPILCYYFLDASDEKKAPGKFRRIGVDGFKNLTTWYTGFLPKILLRSKLFLSVMFAALCLAIVSISSVPAKFFPDSDRPQLLLYFDLPAGVTETMTDEELQKIFAYLGDKEQWPGISSVAGYTGFGGPRFVLSLTPIDPAPNRGFAVLNIKDFDQADRLRKELRVKLEQRFPEVRTQVTNMFLGPSDPGLLEVEVYGPDRNIVFETAEIVEKLLKKREGAVDVQHDWENRASKIVIDIDQSRARIAGVSSLDISNSLSRYFSGEVVSRFRDGDEIYPIILRANDAERQNLERLRSLTIYAPGGMNPVTLDQVAEIRVENEYPRIGRMDQIRTATVQARNDYITPEDWAPLVDEQVQSLRDNLPPGHGIQIAGIIEDSASGSNALAAVMPYCFAAIIIILVMQFGGFKRMVLVLLILPLSMIGAALGLVVMRADFGFMVILGIYSLLGILTVNAIVLLDRIDAEVARVGASVEAIISACGRRVRPILMTTITTILGLLPLILGRDPLFYGLAVVVAFGLAVGTILTLGVIPVLYSLFFGIRPEEGSTDGPAQSKEVLA